MNDIAYQDFDEKAVKMAVYNKINELCRTNDCRQADIVRGTGIAQNTLSGVMTGDAAKQKTLSLKNAILIADFFGITVDELVGRSMRGTTDTSTYGIGKSIADLIHAGKASFGVVTVKEWVPPDTDSEEEPYIDPQDYIQQDMTYPAVYFSANSEGDHIAANRLNHFLQSISKYLKLYEDGHLTDDDLQTLIDKGLRRLTEL